ncbi:MAG: TraR/DksA C4-type zinc finger protein [Candidatus Magasanikbacteria bacterium]|nr:TraR/DksA C4-type zinc finger protein [Candidatus Magasanikbacteria bacterium]
MPKNSSATRSIAVFSADFLSKIKGLLSQEEAKLEHGLAGFTKKNPHVADDFNSTFPDYGDKDDENAAEVAEYAANLSIEQDLERLLRDVKRALQQLKDGSYGICKYCHQPIEERRLLARPTSSACVECKKTITQEV